MTKIIAVQPDRFQSPWGTQSFSDKWLEFLKEDSRYEVRLVDIYGQEGTSSVKDADAFMWRGTGFLHASTAKTIIPAIEYAYGIPTFPSPRLAWLTRDKVAQSVTMKILDIPIPKTWIFFRRSDAESFVETAIYPLVAKLSNGRGSEGVAIVRSKEEARRYVNAMFLYGVQYLDQALGRLSTRALGRLKYALRYLRGRSRPELRESSYAYFQEFLPNNEGDIRVTVIGKYATAFRRHNRPGDFRASGSGLVDYSRDSINASVINLAFDVSRKLKCPFLAIDFLHRNDDFLVCELNFAYIAAVVAQCPYHWILEDSESTDRAYLIEKSIDPEVTTVSEFFRLHQL